METKRILAYAEVLFRENDLSGTKWGAQRVLFRLKRFRGTKCLRLTTCDTLDNIIINL